MEARENAMVPMTTQTSRGTTMLPTISGVAEARLVKMERVMMGMTMPVALALPSASSSRKPSSFSSTPKIRHHTSLFTASWNRLDTQVDSSATRMTLAMMVVGVLYLAGRAGISFLRAAVWAAFTGASDTEPASMSRFRRLASLFRHREATG